MRKIRYCLFSIMLFFTFCLCAKANYGDLKYEVKSFIVTDDGIRITGYAFIHRTQNYVTVHELGENGGKGRVIKSNGGQSVKIIVRGNGTSIEKYYDCRDDDYNFYYQMFNHDNTYSSSFYNGGDSTNLCDPSADSATVCYYEDLGFNIWIPMDEIYSHFPEGGNISFYISAHNNDFGDYTTPVGLMVSRSRLANNSDYIEAIVDGYKPGVARFFAESAQFQNLGGGKYQSGFFGLNNSTYYIYDYNSGSYTDGFWYDFSNNGIGGKSFLNDTTGNGLYALCVNPETAEDACDSVNDLGYCTSCGGKLLSAFASWIEIQGNVTLTLKFKPLKKCDVVTQPAGDLACNDDNGKNYSSTCEELTIKTDSGVLGSVRIDQTGTLSSILLPSKTFAGGGFSFAIMYYHTIKWNYVKTPNTSEERRALELAMMDKIKSYDQFVRELKITNLEFDGKIMDPSFLIKKCTASSTGKDYSGNGITVSCIFYFPDSVVDGSGTVSYKESGYGGISNKFYTPLDYFDDEYEINVRIEGMDRITTSSAREDSKDGIPWTGGPWSTNFRDCTIKVYPLLYNRPDNPYDVKSLTYNFIYRPIDINRPFPDRNPGINWFDWWSVDSNKVRLRTTYERPQYTTVLDSKTIENIKRYNNLEDGRGGYLDWGTMRGDKSSFIDNDAFGFVQKRDNLWGDS